MRKIISILSVLMLFVMSSVNAAEIKDIENHWAKESIEAEIKNGVIDGYKDNTFKPEKEITIVEYLKMIIKSFCLQIILTRCLKSAEKTKGGKSNARQ